MRKLQKKFKMKNKLDVIKIKKMPTTRSSFFSRIPDTTTGVFGIPKKIQDWVASPEKKAVEKSTKNKVSYKELIADKLRYNKDNQCINAFKIMSNPDILKIAYLMIKSKPGNMTEGVDKETLDGIDGN